MTTTQQARGYQLCPQQQRIWGLDPERPARVGYLDLELSGALDEVRLREWVCESLGRHAALTASFVRPAGMKYPLQVLGTPLSIEWSEADLQVLSPPAQDAAMRTAARSVTRRTGGPRPPAIVLYRLGASKRRMHLFLSALQVDVPSLGMIFDEIGSAMSAGERHDESAGLSETTDTLAAYCGWRSQLAGKKAVKRAPHDSSGVRADAPFALPFERSGMDASIADFIPVGRTVDRDAMEALRSLERTSGVALRDVCEAAWRVVLTRLTDVRPIVIGRVENGRTDARFETLVGPCSIVEAVEVDVDGDATFLGLAREIGRARAREREHDRDRDRDRQSGHQPLAVAPAGQMWSAGFEWIDPIPPKRGRGVDLRLIDRRVEIDRWKVKLTCVGKADGTLGLEVAFDSAVWTFDAAQRLADQVRTVLAGASLRPEIAVRGLHGVGPAEAAQAIEWGTGEWGTGERPQTAASARMDAWIAAQAARVPDRVALVGPDATYRYGELDAVGNQIARALRRSGVHRETVVPLLAARGARAVAGMLGVMKAGAAYAPLNLEEPAARLTALIQELGSRIVVGDRRWSALATAAGAHLIALDEPDAQPDAQPVAWTRESTDRLPIAGGGEDLAYAIYTSGSTGQPKAVGVSHESLMQYTAGVVARLGVPAAEPWRFAVASALHADLGHTTLYGGLASGGTVHIIDYETATDGARFAAYLTTAGIDVLKIVPSHWGALWTAAGAGAVPRKCLVFGGERLRPAIAAAVRAAGVRVLNHYGPTETTVGCLTCDAVDVDPAAATVAIGHPLPGAHIYVVDPEGQLAPLGVAGELWIGGAGVARGYLRRPALTAARFVPDPWGKAGARVYRSGDRVRYDARGAVEFLGRTDDQVKVRGYRIEPGEVEAALNAQPAVQTSIVIAREDADGTTRLIGYVVPRPGQTIDLQAVEAALRESLPEYMWPQVEVLAALPLTRNGKVDRAALPDPAVRSTTEYVAPRTSTEAVLAQVWAQVLGVPQVGVHDNFFALGGDSILSIQIVARAQQHGVQVTPRAVLDAPTVAALAQVATAAAPARPAPAAAAEGERVPPLPIQQWFFARDVGVRPHFNQALLLQWPEPPRLAWLETAIAGLAAQHDSLRFRYQETVDGWTQVYGPARDAAAVTCVDLRELSGAELAAARTTIALAVQRSLDLRHGPVWRAVALIGPTPADGRLLLVGHHLVVDGVSWRVLLEDLDRAWTAAQAGTAVAWPRRTSSYGEWARQLTAWAATPAVQRSAAWWAAQEARAPRGPLSLDWPEGANREADARSLEVTLDALATRQLLHETGAAYQTEILDLLLTALARVVGPSSGAETVRVELEGHGRETIDDAVDVTRTVGWFTTRYPVVLDGWNGAPGETLRAVKEQLRQVPHHGLSYSARQMLGDAVPASLPGTITFNYLGQFDRLLGASGRWPVAQESVGPLRDGACERSSAVSVDGWVVDGRLHLHWTYSAAQFRQATISRLADAYLVELGALIEHCRGALTARTPSDFPLAALDQASLDRVLAATGASRIETISQLSPLQSGLLVSSLSAGASADVYVRQDVWTLQGTLDVPSFFAAWDHICRRHAILRASFAWDHASAPVQIVHRAPVLPRHEEDWRGLTTDARDARLERLCSDDRARGFDLATPPLMRVTLIRIADDTWQAIWTYHHLLLDGWSKAIVVAELIEAYRDFVSHAGPRLEPAPGFIDYMQWLRTQDPAAAEQYWRTLLAGFREPNVVCPSDGDGDAMSAGPIDRITRTVDPESRAAIDSLARREQITVSTLFHAVWALWLSQWTGDADVVFGTVVSGRNGALPGIERIVGPLMSTVPFRARITASELFVHWLATLQAQRHESTSFEHVRLADLQSWADIPPGRPLFTSLLGFENYPRGTRDDAENDGAVTIRAATSYERTNFPLGLLIVPGDSLHVHLEFDTHQFSLAGANQMLDYLIALVGTATQALAEPALTIGQVFERAASRISSTASSVKRAVSRRSLLTPDERERLLVANNATDRPFPSVEGVHRLFEASARRHAASIAVSDGEDVWTYERLNHRANQLARILLERGARPEARVALCLDRSPEALAAVLAVLKAGAAYVPLDPRSPQERLAYMLRDADVALAVTSTADDRLPAAVPRLALRDAEETIARQDGSDLPAATRPENLAYVIYTSGSTGRPKGVQVTHASFCNLARALHDTYEMNAASRVLQLVPFNFDVFGFEMMATLCAGGRLCIATGEAALGGPAVLDLIRREGVTIAGIPTAMLAQMRPDSLPSLRTLMVGGETCHADLPDRWAPGRRFFNGYGPTETTVFATVGECHAGGGQPGIGRPIPNAQVYVLDEAMEPVPTGVMGELFIGGAGVARGYWNRPALTAERFVPDPFGAPGSRLYRSGDRVRWQSDGVLYYGGRIDRQIKLRGVRIEPGEIEAAISDIPGVDNCVVAIRSGRDGASRLVAYVASTVNLTAEQVRQHVESRLPAPMVPSAVVCLAELPLTSSGKIDWDALPNQVETAPGQRGRAPETPTEQKLADLWRQVLGVSDVRTEDNFFELGGHSLMATQLVYRIRDAFGVPLPISRLLATPVFSAMHRIILLERLSALDPARARALVERVKEQAATLPQARA